MTTHGSSRAEYRLRINQAMDFVQANLHRPLRLEEIARAAFFSPFHFHRIFQAMLGETVSDYVQRQRLEKAVNTLALVPSLPVTEIALNCGFSSSANFARALKKRFGLTATEIRREGLAQRAGGRENRKQGQAKGKTGKARNASAGYASDTTHSQGRFRSPGEERHMDLKVEVKDLPKRRIAYVRVIGAYNSADIGAAYQELMKWAGPRDLLGPGTQGVGVSHDNPDVTPPEKCRYDAGIVIPENAEVSGRINAAEIPPGKYAVARYEGPDTGYKEAYRYLYGEWLPGSGYQPADGPPLEVCLNNPKNHPKGHFITDIQIPVKPL